MDSIYKVSVNFNEKDHRFLESFSADNGISQADSIRKALSYYKFMDDAVKNQNKILVEDKYHNLRKVVFN
jgi:hypothetical protein